MSRAVLTKEHAALIKALLARGEKHQDIALVCRVNQGRVADVKAGRRFRDVPALSARSVHVMEAMRLIHPPKMPDPPTRIVFNAGKERVSTPMERAVLEAESIPIPAHMASLPPHDPRVLAYRGNVLLAMLVLR